MAPIIATAPVPAHARLDTADTRDLALTAPGQQAAAEAEAYEHGVMFGNDVDGEPTVTGAEQRAYWRGYADGCKDSKPTPKHLRITLRRVLADAVGQLVGNVKALVGNVKAWWTLRQVQRVLDNDRLSREEKIERLGLSHRVGRP